MSFCLPITVILLIYLPTYINYRSTCSFIQLRAYLSKIVNLVRRNIYIYIYFFLYR